MLICNVFFLAEKRAFKDKRSKHYDEFSNVQKARELIAKELADLENEGEEVSIVLRNFLAAS